MRLHNLWIPSLLVVVGGGAFYFLGQSSTKGTTPAAVASGEPLNADDLARVLGHNIKKWTITLPRDDYGICIWAECWRKNDPTPQVTLLFSTAIMPLDQATVLFDMPTPAKPEGFFACNGVAGRASIKDMIGREGFVSFSQVPSTVHPNDDIDLGIFVPNNEDGSPSGADATTGHLTPMTHADVTYIFRARFVPGREALTPTWNGTQVQLQKWQNKAVNTNGPQ